jgi:hypothetical protein
MLVLPMLVMHGLLSLESLVGVFPLFQVWESIPFSLVWLFGIVSGFAPVLTFGRAEVILFRLLRLFSFPGYPALLDVQPSILQTKTSSRSSGVGELHGHLHD